MRYCSCFVAVLIALSWNTPAPAVLVFSNLRFESTNNNNSFTLATEFTLGSQPLLLTQLGVYDSDQDGLDSALQVGVWNSLDQSLVASATVPAGTSGTLVEDWRFTPLGSSVQLEANTTYRIGAFFDDSNLDEDPSGGFIDTLSGVSLTTGSFNRPGVFGFPGTLQSGVTRFVANAMVAIPEPSAFLFGLIVSSVCGLRRSRP